MNDDTMREAVMRFGSPLYLYLLPAIEQRIASLAAALPGRFGIRYAVKTNPNPHLLRWLHGRIESLDVSSGGELKLALACGWEPGRIAFTGPAKTPAELSAAVDATLGRIVVESTDEARLLSDIAVSRRTRQRVSVRIAPRLPEDGFAIRLAGRPTQFGIDEEVLPDALAYIAALPGLELDGLHVYSGSQCLDGASLAEHFRQTADVFVTASGHLPGPVNEFVFGAGMGIPYHDNDSELDLGPLGDSATSVLDTVDACTTAAAPAIRLEIGRYLVGEAGAYLTRVIRVKETRGTRILICDGGMNHNLGASGQLGGTAHRHYRMRVIGRAGAGSTCRVVGPLCTTVDTLAHRVRLPDVEAGDILAVSCSGAYGPTASPLFFISHALPREVAVDVRDGVNECVDVSWLPTPDPVPADTATPPRDA